MHKLLTAALALSFGVAYAQAPAEKTAKPAGEKPAAKTAGTKPAATKPATKAPAAEKGAATTAGKTPAGEAPAMTPPKPGPETEALMPFSKSITSTGTVPAGAYGANPEMPTRGRATCKWTLDKLWISCDIQDTMGKGKQAMKWAGHWIFGYDFGDKGYRGVMTDNWGTQTEMKGTLDGSKLTWESVGEVDMNGKPTKIRITEDATDPKAIKFTSEHQADGKWVVDETAVHKTRG